MSAIGTVGTNRIRLRTELASQYKGLVKSLTRRLGSADNAYEALHEAYIRLDRVSDAVPVRCPTDYIFRTALNIASDKRRTLNRTLRATEIDEILHIDDDEPGPARIVEARLEVEAIRAALNNLPERPRDVFRSISMEGRSAEQVAARLSVSLRTVESDFKLALNHCADRVGRRLPRRSGGPRPWR